MYSKSEKIIMWLTSFDFMSYKKAKALIENIDDLEDMFDNTRNLSYADIKLLKKEPEGRKSKSIEDANHWFASAGNIFFTYLKN